MNPIVSQSGQVPYSPTPLLLAAPRIAGLLPAHVGPPGQASQRPASSAEFTYRNSTLAKLSAERRAQVIDAAMTLLDVAVAYAHGTLNDNALRAAQVLFHRQLTGHRVDHPGRQAAGGHVAGRHTAGGHAGPPLHPTAYRAERDADLLEWWVGARKRISAGEVVP